MARNLPLLLAVALLATLTATSLARAAETPVATAPIPPPPIVRRMPTASAHHAAAKAARKAVVQAAAHAKRPRHLAARRVVHHAKAKPHAVVARTDLAPAPSAEAPPVRRWHYAADLPPVPPWYGYYAAPWRRGPVPPPW